MPFLRHFKIQFFVFFSMFLSIMLLSSSSEARRYTGPEKRAELVIDAETGRILHSYAADQRRYPASTTKMLTLYIIFEALEKGLIKPDTQMRMTQEIRTLGRRNGGVIFTGVGVGKTISVKEGIYTLITKSANDIAILFGRTLAGSEQNFARRMTQKAHELGMNSSHFTNPSGLPDKNQYTTAHDMALLGMRLMQRFPSYYKYFGTKNIRIKGQYLHNHNGMLLTYKGMDGFKTGFINMSGFNLVGSAKRGNKRLVAVMFGGSSVAARNYRMKQILDAGWIALNNPQKYNNFIGTKVANIASLETKYSPLDSGVSSAPTMVAAVEPKKQSINELKEAALIANRNARAALKKEPAAKVIQVAHNDYTPEQSDKNIVTNAVAQEMPAPTTEVIAPAPTVPQNALFQQIDKSTGLDIEKILNSNIPTSTISSAAPTQAPVIKSIDMRLPSKTDYEKKEHILQINQKEAVKNPFQNASKGSGWQIQFHDAEKDKSILTLENKGTEEMMVVGKENNSDSRDFVADIIDSYDVKPQTSLSDYTLQVGAFSQKKTADNYMGTLKSNVQLLSSAEPVLKTVKKGSGVIYRAMFAGLSATSAKTACKEIKKQGRQCTVVAQAS